MCIKPEVSIKHIYLGEGLDGRGFFYGASLIAGYGLELAVQTSWRECIQKESKVLTNYNMGFQLCQGRLIESWVIDFCTYAHIEEAHKQCVQRIAQALEDREPRLLRDLKWALNKQYQ